MGVLTNQSGVGRGMITTEQVRAVNARIETLLGPFDGWYVCEHGPGDDCDCRKPGTKLVSDAARAWNIDPSRMAIVGDKEDDVLTARNAGAVAIRVKKDDGAALRSAVDKILS